MPAGLMSLSPYGFDGLAAGSLLESLYAPPAQNPTAPPTIPKLLKSWPSTAGPPRIPRQICPN